MSDDQPEQYPQFRFRLPPGAADLLLVRHGESQPARFDQPFPTVDGQADPPLDPRGQEEAERVAERLAGEEIAAVYVTPLRRTQETAEPLVRRLGMEPRVEPGLREVRLGEWEGAVFRARMREGHPLAKRLLEEERWDAIPGAESTEGFITRVRSALEGLATAHCDERVVVFTHGGVIATAAALATESRRFAFLGADNGSLTHLVITDDHWILRRFNDTGHLRTDLDRPPEPLT